MSWIRSGTLLLAAALVALPACDRGEGPLPEKRVRRTIFGMGAPVVRTTGGDTVHVSEAVAELYKGRGYAPVWTEGENVLERADEALQVLGNAVQDGLDPARYRYQVALDIRREFEETEHDIDDPAEERLLGDLDVILTEGFRRYARDLAMGTLNPEEVTGYEWEIERNADPGSTPIEAVANGAAPSDVASSLRPITPYYERLMRALARYRSIEAEGGWPMVGDLPKLEPGDEHSGVARLRARLIRGGDTTEARLAAAGSSNPRLYDESLAQAVQSFQHRHGLARDGIIGSSTRDAMNVPVRQRILSLRTNMDRWRWLPRDMGSSFILVNVAGAEMEVVEDDTTIMAMNVVVGKTGHETPIFQDTLEHIVVNPYWNVPESIAEEEIRPLAARDPTYLARNNYEVVDGGRIRQRPGPTNALGQVKFLFPNRHNVYLHDTPADHLFSQNERAFSHGCVRVERPRDLARLLFEKTTDRDADDFDQLRARDSEQWVNVDRKLPVYILYFTAWATPTGEVHFYPDIYRRDRQLEGQVEERLAMR